MSCAWLLWSSFLDLDTVRFNPRSTIAPCMVPRACGLQFPRVESQFGSQISAKRTNHRLVVGLGGPVNSMT